MIAVVIFLLLGNLLASALTILSVFATVVEVVGFMHFWGNTIDSVMVIFVVISMGLSVDYSAHIAHGFLFATGTRGERREAALLDTGVAVFNGAFSTMIAIVLLVNSQTFAFLTFFRALILTVTFGLANGMMMLPVLLTWANPQSFKPEGKMDERQKLQGSFR